jgi:hypothetical protein
MKTEIRGDVSFESVVLHRASRRGPLPVPVPSFAIGTSNTSQMRSNVVTVIGRPASICCQCLVENPKVSMSSCEYPRSLRSSRTLIPRARKNCS